MRIKKSLLKASIAAALPAMLLASAFADPQLYVGGGIGWNWTKANNTVHNDYVYDPSTSTNYTFTNNPYNTSSNDVMQNIFIGVSNRFAHDIYGALQLGVYRINSTGYANSSSTSPVNGGSVMTKNFSFQMAQRYELAGIVGYNFSPRFLTYAKLGATATSVQEQFSIYETANSPAYNGYAEPNQTLRKQLYGAVFGLGTMYSINSHWNVGAEADYVQYFNAIAPNCSSNLTVRGAAVCNPADSNYRFTSQSISTKLHQYSAQANVSYSF